MASAEPISPLIRWLCEELEAEGIRYCHWKSNWRLQRWAEGQGDLDLLVRRSDWLRFTALLSRSGFRQVAAPGALVPGIQHYYGLEAATGRFVHVHAHSQLVVGHDLSKNYHLPLEEAFLASARRQGALYIPVPELELILYVLRMVLKYSTLELWRRKRGLSPSVYEEYQWLSARADPEQVPVLLRRHLGGVDSALFRDCVRTLHPGCSNWTRLAVRWRLARRLRAHARLPLVLDSVVRFWRRLRLMVRHRLPHPPTRKLLSNGGAIVALLGGDGAGKTTAVSALHHWLTKAVATRRIHLGKPPCSLATRIAGFLVRGAKHLFGEQPPVPHAGTSGLSSTEYLQMIRYVCIARDRLRLYTQARRFATAGGVVICDRFPHPQITLMDGPKIPRLLAGRRGSRLADWLQQLEADYYAQMLAPELLIALMVDPEMAVQRKPEENPDQVRIRSTEFWRLDCHALGAHRVDAGRPAEEVLAELKALVWAGI